MADNNVVRFRRPEKKPDKPTGAKGSTGQPAARAPRMSQGQLSAVAWALIIGFSIAYVAAQQWGLIGR